MLVIVLVLEVRIVRRILSVAIAGGWGLANADGRLRIPSEHEHEHDYDYERKNRACGLFWLLKKCES